MRLLIFLFLMLLGSAHAFTQLSIQSVSNMTSKEKDKLVRVVSGVERVINSESFKQAVVSYRGIPGGFHMSQGHTPEVVYATVMQGRELLSEKVDSRWDLYYSKRVVLSPSTTAFTNPGTRVVTFSSKYYANVGDARLAGTICHEQAHKLGYGHESKPTVLRPKSVPYALGSICETLYANLIMSSPNIVESVELDPIIVSELSESSQQQICNFWCRVASFLGLR